MTNINEFISDFGRIYKINDINYPSVTTIINNVIPYDYSLWKQRNPNHEELLNYSIVLGKIVHHNSAAKLLKKWNMRNDPLILSDNDKIILKKFIDTAPSQKSKKYHSFKEDINWIKEMFDEWIDKYNPQPLDYNEEFIFPSEGLIYNLELMYAGRYDIVCNINGENQIVDIKTSDHISINYEYQLSAYKYALENRYKNINIQKQSILNLVPNGIDYKFTNLSYLKEYWKDMVLNFYKTTNINELSETKNKFLNVYKL
jgi:hypothetical protein